jgi:hypothetical protein
MKLRLLALLAIVAGCSDDAPGELDAAVDAPADAADAPDAEIDAPDGGRCPGGFFLTGEMSDWDSTLASFAGVGGAVWTVRGDTERTTTSAPNGRIELCTAAQRADLDVDRADYLDMIYVSVPAVFEAPGQFFFAVKGLRTTRAPTFYAELGLTFDLERAHVLVQKQGPATGLTLGAGGTAFVSDGPEDLTWTAGNSGTFVLFANVPVTGAMTTLEGAVTAGPAMVPIEAGKLTITTIR